MNLHKLITVVVMKVDALLPLPWLIFFFLLSQSQVMKNGGLIYKEMLLRISDDQSCNFISNDNGWF